LGTGWNVEHVRDKRAHLPSRNRVEKRVVTRDARTCLVQEADRHLGLVERRVARRVPHQQRVVDAACSERRILREAAIHQDELATATRANRATTVSGDGRPARATATRWTARAALLAICDGDRGRVPAPATSEHCAGRNKRDGHLKPS